MRFISPDDFVTAGELYIPLIWKRRKMMKRLLITAAAWRMLGSMLRGMFVTPGGSPSDVVDRMVWQAR